MANRSSGRWRWTRRLAEAMSAGLLLASPASLAAELPPLVLARAGESDAASAPLQLYLEVSLNQTAYGTPQPFELRDGRLFASVATLRQIGFVLDGRGEAESLAPDSLPGVAVRYDAALQRVAIDAPLSQLSLATTRLNAPGTDVPDASASPGVLLNYDFYSSRDDHGDSTSAFAELRAFGLGRGVFSQTAVTRSHRSEDTPRRTESVRLDSSWRWSSPASMVSVSVGDVISGQLDWTRPLRLGGVRIGRDFGLQPYRITTPLPTFVGEVAVPSAVDLYVNGIRQYSGELPPGPFQLATIPGITGAGNAQLVVTDAFGRTRQIDFPFYAAQQLLAKGLSDWSLSLGLAREDYALRSFAYGSEPLASADLRYGVSDEFTVEAHAEGGDGVVNGGLGGIWLLGRAGVVSASLAHGQGRQDHRHDAGWLYAAAYNWSNGRFNLSADTQRTHGEYRDIASRYGQGPARVRERAVASWNDSRLGSVGLSYVRLLYRGETPARYGSATWSRNFRSGATLSLSYNQNLDRSEDRNVYLGFSMNFDRSLQLSASVQRNRGRDQAVLDLSRPMPGDGGFGWRLQARGGDGEEGGLAEAGWLTSFGRYSLGLARQGDVDYGYTSASGSLVWMGGHVFAARNVSDAFAVVSTDGRADVPVLLENRPIGRTDRDGMLLVTPLNAWQRNRIAIDPMELPADLRLDRVEVQATPQDRSGTLVRFGIEQVRAAVVVLHDAHGEPLPVGSRVQLGAGTNANPNASANVVVGYDGETYFDNLHEHNAVRVDTADGPCSVRFDYPAGGGVPRIGPLICQRQGSP